ncbi:hypothetical protein NDU88_000760 [Pleurodeles waltl]|uniref:Uncharacterized protein n=1 Tax=Pleurodeles waltl TaxID=8319 RepID=A0AAV7MJJ2_PLEWA|nr:hypothetical protein NDU88_000760 [Pleurodeles waltl]
MPPVRSRRPPLGRRRHLTSTDTAHITTTLPRTASPRAATQIPAHHPLPECPPYQCDPAPLCKCSRVGTGKEGEKQHGAGQRTRVRGAGASGSALIAGDAEKSKRTHERMGSQQRSGKSERGAAKTADEG